MSEHRSIKGRVLQSFFDHSADSFERRHSVYIRIYRERNWNFGENLRMVMSLREWKTRTIFLVIIVFYVTKLL